MPLCLSLIHIFLNTIHENYEYIPVRSSYILQLHRDLYRYSEKSIGGQFKNSQNFISAVDANGRAFILFEPLPPYETPAAIDSICENYNRVSAAQEIDDLILIPVLDVYKRQDPQRCAHFKPRKVRQSASR